MFSFLQSKKEQAETDNFMLINRSPADLHFERVGIEESKVTGDRVVAIGKKYKTLISFLKIYLMPTIILLLFNIKRELKSHSQNKKLSL